MYQQDVENTKNEASILYQQLLEVAIGDNVTEESAASVDFIANKIKSEFEGSEYAAYSALFLAKSAVSKNELDVAEAELKWVLDTNSESSLNMLVKGRLARVLDAQGKTEDALALLDDKNAGEYSAMYLEIKGDIYIRAGDIESAKSAYISAYTEMKASGTHRPMLTLKMADLGISEEGA